ncbi:zinc transporter [Pycnococcus provasolii]
MPPPTASHVAWVTFVASCLAGLGATPFFFTGKLSRAWSGVANTLACGAMIAASFDILHEASEFTSGAMAVLIGVVAGAFFVQVTQRCLEVLEERLGGGVEGWEFATLRGADARKTILIVGIMTAHCCGEGNGLGLSFSEPAPSDAGGANHVNQGALVSIAIGLHNIPEGLTVAAVLAARGVGPVRCMLWAIASHLPQCLIAVPSYVFVQTFDTYANAVALPLRTLGLGFAAGCMLWMVFAELLPDALAVLPPRTVATVGTCSAAVIECLRLVVGVWESTAKGGVGWVSLLSLPMATAAAAAVTAAAVTVVDVSTLSSAQARAAGGGVACGALLSTGIASLLGHVFIANAGAATVAAAAGIGAFLCMLAWKHWATLVWALKVDFDIDHAGDGASADDDDLEKVSAHGAMAGAPAPAPEDQDMCEVSGTTTEWRRAATLAAVTTLLLGGVTPSAAVGAMMIRALPAALAGCGLGLGACHTSRAMIHHGVGLATIQAAAMLVGGSTASKFVAPAAGGAVVAAAYVLYRSPEKDSSLRHAGASAGLIVGAACAFLERVVSGAAL